MGPQASSIAGEMDLLFWILIALTVFFSGLVAVALTYFGVKYRRRTPDEVPVQIEGSIKLELTWTLIPLVLALGVFVWGALLYVKMSRPPADAMEIYVVGRQWMWKAQQPSGQWENNELHVPVGRPVKLTMTSQDVLHDFAVPAFRVKQDILPGRYTQLWFTATKPGEYPLFCSEYCGVEHSKMTGKVFAMSEVDYQAWLGGQTTGESPAAAGQRLFSNLGCVTCHRSDSLAKAPYLGGLYGSQVRLQNGQTVTADEEYIRESILNSQAQVVQGFQPIMPIFQGQVNEEQLLQLVAYVKSLSGQQPGGGAKPGTQPGTSPESRTNPDTSTTSTQP